MKKEALILFKSALVEKHIKVIAKSKGTVKYENAKTISNGYMFSPEIIVSYSSQKLRDFSKLIEKELIIKGSQINNAFHKSWDKVANASDFQLYMEQIVHYMTTYGLESLGVEYNKDNVFVPYEKLEIPELKKDVPLIYIKGITKDELKERVLAMLSSGVALKEDTMNMLYDILDEYKLSDEDLSSIKNKEIKMMLYEKYNIIPENPIEFLRYLIYEATGGTLLIKSRGVIEQIKALDNKSTIRRLVKLFNSYENRYGLEKLSTIFLRFKPIFLAMRHIGDS